MTTYDPGADEQGANEVRPHVDIVGNSGDHDLADRHALRRVAGLGTELEDVTEVEYRQVRLERVVLAG
ncbi:MAG: GTPase HflX, partial [Candidatus Nanopelagicales bacterium]